MFTTWDAFPMLDRVLDDVMAGVTGTAFGTGARQAAFEPAIDIRANQDELVFVCDVPGVKQEDLDVSIEGSTLTIEGERRYEGAEQDRVWLGRAYGAFRKAFTLPSWVNTDAMTAHLADGVLTLRLPKRPEAKPRRIPVGSSNPTKQLGEKQE